MYCSRPVARSPTAVRIVRPAANRCGGGRNASFLAHPFHHRFSGAPAFASSSNEFAPIFRIFDELTAPLATPQFRNNFAAYQPRFDVREVGDTYEVSGELPGIEGKDIEVEFKDSQTLIVRGRTEKETTSGNQQTAGAENAEVETTQAVAEEPAAATDNSDAASTYSTGSYQKPSVEDEYGAGQPTPAESSADAAEKTEVAAQEPKQQQPSSHYWVSERSTGSFQRVFNFPVHIDQEAVKASLKNGILNIVVPKAPVPAAKKITVE